MNSKTTLTEKNANNYLTHTMKKRGISLIVLIITIIVIIVLATAIIVNIAQTNIIKNAEKAVLENNIAQVQEALRLKLSEITLKEKEAPVIYTDETFETEVIDRVCINSEDETIGKVYYKTSKKKFCIVFGKEENAKGNNVIEVATTENVAIDDIEYRYTNQNLPTDKGISFKWYITNDNKVEIEKDWLTTDTQYRETDAGEICEWIGIQADEEIPEGTRIKYSFSKSNDRVEWTTYSDDIADNGNSQYIKVKIQFQKENTNITQNAVLNDLIVNYRLLPDIYVTTTGNDGTGDGSSEAPYATLAKAIDVAEDGDRIYVAAGEYILTPIYDSSYSGVGIWDRNKKLEIYGENEKTILKYDGSTSTKRDGCAITLSNSESILRNLTYVFYPKSGSNYSRAIFRANKGTMENVFFRISGTNKASYVYASSPNMIVENCTFYHDLESVDDNYDSSAKFNNIATNVTTIGTNTNVITSSFDGGNSGELYYFIYRSYKEQTFKENQVGVFFGNNAWPNLSNEYENLLCMPTINVNLSQFPYTLTLNGIENDGDDVSSYTVTATITGDNSDATGFLYRINNGEWQEYKGAINVEAGNKIYAKYKFNDALALAYSLIDLPKIKNSFTLNSAAYDNDLDSNMTIQVGDNGITSSGSKYLYLKLDESVIGKTFNIKWYSWNYSGYIARLHVLNRQGNIIQENAATINGGNTEIDSFIIPEGAEYLKLHFICSSAGWGVNYRIYEMYISD